MGNYYQIIYELKKLLKETSEIELSEISLQSSKILCFIQTCKKLSEEYSRFIKLSTDPDSAAKDFIFFLNAVYNDTLDKEDLNEMPFNGISEYIYSIFSKLNTKQKEIFIDIINKDCYSIGDICLQLASIYKNTDILEIMTQKNKLRLATLKCSKSLTMVVSIDLLEILSITTMFNTIEEYTDKILLKVILRYILSEFIFYMAKINANNIYEKAYEKATIEQPLECKLDNHKKLSSREISIFNYINEDSSIKDIANCSKDFSKNQSTTKKHLKNIATKLGYDKKPLDSIKKYKRLLNNNL